MGRCRSVPSGKGCVRGRVCGLGRCQHEQVPSVTMRFGPEMGGKSEWEARYTSDAGVMVYVSTMLAISLQSLKGWLRRWGRTILGGAYRTSAGRFHLDGP